MSDRKAMTPARRARILAQHGGRCAVAGCDHPGPYEVDHVIPLGLAADAAHRAELELDANLEPLCPPHHLGKTRVDWPAIARAKRREKKHREPRPPGKVKGGAQLRSRPFPQASRPFPSRSRKIPSRPFR